MRDIRLDLKEQERRIAFVDGLRRLADFLEVNPDLPVPYGSEYFNVWVFEKEDIAQLVRGKGKWEKKVDNTYVSFRKDFGPLNYDINIHRDKVCERVVVGETIVPARPAEPERVIEKIEWHCTPIFEHEIESEFYSKD